MKRMIPVACCEAGSWLKVLAGLVSAGVTTNIDNTMVPNGTDTGGAEVFKAFAAGWARIDLFEYPYDSDGNDQFDTTELRDYIGYDDNGYDGDDQYGLPATGFWVYEANNGYLTDDDGNRALGNYGGLWDHKATRCFYGSDCRNDD